MKTPIPPRFPRRLAATAALLGLALSLGGCKTSATDVTGSVPDDYRQRHPIAVQEGKHSTVVFIGSARGGLTAAQRADVHAIAQNWLREGTGAITIDVPTRIANAKVAMDS